ncbi:MAG TPA: hypothetical protein VMT52_04015 [Planctomycetota bacterium]|nr:hypothetical protein [Planctomycetota bacterium]
MVRLFKLWRKIRVRHAPQIEYLRMTHFEGPRYGPTEEDARLFGCSEVLQVERNIEGSIWVWHKVGVLQRYGYRRIPILRLMLGEGHTHAGEQVEFVAYRGKNKPTGKPFVIYFRR